MGACIVELDGGGKPRFSLIPPCGPDHRVPPETNNGSDGNECDCCSTGATAGARVGTILIFFVMY